MLLNVFIVGVLLNETKVYLLIYKKVSGKKIHRKKFEVLFHPGPLNPPKIFGGPGGPLMARGPLFVFCKLIHTLPLTSQRDLKDISQCHSQVTHSLFAMSTQNISEAHFINLNIIVRHL